MKKKDKKKFNYFKIEENVKKKKEKLEPLDQTEMVREIKEEDVISPNPIVIENIENEIKQEEPLDMFDEDQGSDKELKIEEVISFFISEKEYAVNILNIIEIVLVDKVNPISNAQHYIEGLYNFRGEMIPVINLERKFGIDDDVQKHFGIVCSVSGKVMCLLTRKIIEVIYIEKVKTFDLPNLIAGVNDYLAKVIKFSHGKNTRVVSIIRLENLFSSEEKIALGKIYQKK